MDEQRHSRMDQMLDLLTEELRERLAESEKEKRPVQQDPSTWPAQESIQMMGASATVTSTSPEQEIVESVESASPPLPGLEPGLPAEAAEPSHAARLMRRLALWLFVAVIAINIPFSSHGTTLATAMPDAASYIVRDGFVVKEEDDPEFYVYQDGHFRWISSLDAFEHYGYSWEDVHIVPDGYLDRYEIGTPIHVLLKCPESPHIYRLEEGKKRWIRDIDTFVAEGHEWDDVRFVSCHYLRQVPDGETIPSNAGTPPQP